MQPRRPAPKERYNVTAARDPGRVTAIPYSWLAMSLRSLAIMFLYTNTYYHLHPHLRRYSYINHTYAYEGAHWCTCPDTQNKQMTAVGYISDTEEIVKASWSNFQHDDAAAFTLSYQSPVPPAFSAKDIPGGRTQILNVRRTKQIVRHPAESDQDSSPESISATENCFK